MAYRPKDNKKAHPPKGMRFDLCFFCELFQTEFFADFLCYVLAEALADVRYATCYIHDVNIFALIAHSFNGINDFLCDFAPARNRGRRWKSAEWADKTPEVPVRDASWRCREVNRADGHIPDLFW